MNTPQAQMDSESTAPLGKGRFEEMGGGRVRQRRAERDRGPLHALTSPHRQLVALPPPGPTPHIR